MTKTDLPGSTRARGRTREQVDLIEGSRAFLNDCADDDARALTDVIAAKIDYLFGTNMDDRGGSCDECCGAHDYDRLELSYFTGGTLRSSGWTYADEHGMTCHGPIEPMYTRGVLMSSNYSGEHRVRNATQYPDLYGDWVYCDEIRYVPPDGGRGRTDDELTFEACARRLTATQWRDAMVGRFDATEAATQRMNEAATRAGTEFARWGETMRHNLLNNEREN